MVIYFSTLVHFLAVLKYDIRNYLSIHIYFYYSFITRRNYCLHKFLKIRIPSTHTEITTILQRNLVYCDTFMQFR